MTVLSEAFGYWFYIGGCKLDFSVRTVLRQECPSSPLLFITFMDRISRRNWEVEGFWFGHLRIASLLFADDGVLLASSALAGAVCSMKRR